jgi:transposase InsO family protein
VAIVRFAREYPLEGYRRLTFMMMDRDIVAVSPASVYRGLREAGMIQSWAKPTRKGTGFVQPLQPHERWHIDFSYVNVGGTFYYLCSILDGCSRFIVHWEIREAMKEADAEIVLQRAREKFPQARPRIISDNGPQFIAKDFKEFIRLWQTSQVLTSPHYPQSNGKLERFHRTLKEQAIRPRTPLSLEQARQVVQTFVERYNLVPKLKVSVAEAIGDLPRLRSGLSKEPDFSAGWCEAVRSIRSTPWLNSSQVDDLVRREIRSQLQLVAADLDRGAEWMRPSRRSIQMDGDWFADARPGAVCNHATRSHIREDLHRYFFVSTFARVHGRSPLLNDFPKALLPDPVNVVEALKETKFNDRFRVQVANRPATTVTSHLSKDGHYFIHPDPAQCRSLTVREAARLQTFPDNYFFEGPRTAQYHQAGNAAPPLLAHQIAAIVADLFV